MKQLQPIDKLVIGAVCIAAIIKCGLIAVGIISAVAVIAMIICAIDAEERREREYHKHLFDMENKRRQK